MKTRDLVALALVVTPALPGCSSSQSNNQPAVRRNVAHIANATAVEDRSRCNAALPRRTASEYDTNGDGQPDVRKVYQIMGEGAEMRSVLICREVDLNHDGVKDMFRFYNEEGRTLREEEDRDFDGRIDVITYFEAGEVVRRELDTNHDGMVDMRVFYREHQPYRAEREVNANNNPEFRPDYWEFYDAHGQVVRIGWDYDGDGRADRWDRLDRVAPPAAANAASLTNNSDTAAQGFDPTGGAGDPDAGPPPSVLGTTGDGGAASGTNNGASGDDAGAATGSTSGSSSDQSGAAGGSDAGAATTTGGGGG